ncbi:MAG: Rieske (2Fe-2S) protein [Chloroflexi bacterium]|nr:Rieske (2Fe-2S) protein [Chloroflexota bacterium]MBV9600258.1 Rieske (2Fe-2S) protein [Chloroflexota bacterium]
MVQTDTNTGTEWRTVCALADLPVGRVHAIRCGATIVALVRGADDQVFALENTCPHRGGPLAGGKLVAGEIACPWHGFRFDPRTGAATVPTPHAPATSIPVRIAGEDVQVLVN